MTTNTASLEEQPDLSIDATPLLTTKGHVLTNQDKVNRWLEKDYLRHDLDDGGEAVISIQELLNIIRTEHPECLMSEQTVTLALDLAVKHAGRENTLVISDVHAQKLYALGVGFDEQAEVRQAFPNLHKALLDPEKRWIVIPCNDGVLQTGEIGESLSKHDKPSDADTAETTDPSASGEIAEEERESATQDAEDVHPSAAVEQEDENEKDDEDDAEDEAFAETSNQSKSQVQHGTHWGLLVIDKSNKVARWVDSTTTIRRVITKDGSIKWRASMHPAAKAAGIILRGFDVLLGEENGFPKDGFTTSTLKWNPNQGEDNASDDDSGACGPFVFAFLEYIMARATELDSVGVRKMFPRSKKGRIQFDSIQARHNIRRLVQQEGEKHGAGTDSLPFKLTPDIVRILMTVEHFQQFIDVFQGRVNVPDRPSKNLLTSTNRPASASRLASSRSKEGVDFSEPGFRSAFAYAKNENPNEYQGLSENEQMEHFFQLQQAAVTSAAVPRKPEFYLGEHLYRGVPSQNTDIWPEHDTDSNKMPGAYKTLPAFDTLKNPSVAAWFNKNHDLHTENVARQLDDITRFTARARLHYKFKKTFLGELDESFIVAWSFDQEVFDSGKEDVRKVQKGEATRAEIGLMRREMMRHYMGNEAVEKVEKALKDYKVNPSTQSKGRKNNKGDKSDKGGKDNPGKDNSDDDDQPKPDGPGTRTRPASNVSAGRRAALQDSEAFQAIANQPINFASMEEADVVEWVHRTASRDILRADMNAWERREQLQAAFGSFDTDHISKQTAGDHRSHLNLVSSLSFRQIINELRQRTRNVPDLRGQIQWYPDYYLREHSVLPAANDDEAGHNRSSKSPELSAEPTTTTVGTLTGDETTRESDEPPAIPVGSATDGSHEGPESFTRREDDGEGNDDPDGSGSPTGRRSDEDGPGDGDEPGDDDDDDDDDDGPPGGGDEILGHEPVDFRTMELEKLSTYMTEERRADPRLRGNPNEQSWRAFLFVTVHGRHFIEESDNNCLQLWLNDTIVFSDEDRAQDWKGLDMIDIIRAQMDAHYRTTPPAAITDSTTKLSETDSGSEDGSPAPSDSSKSPKSPARTTGKRKRDDTEANAPSKRTRAAGQIAEDDRAASEAAATGPSAIATRGPPFIGFTPTLSPPPRPTRTPPGSENLEELLDDLSSPHDSNDESVPSPRSGSGAASREPRSSSSDSGRSKRSREPEKDDLEDGSGKSKKPRTERTITIPVSASFESSTTVEDETIEVHVGRRTYIASTDNPLLFPAADTTRTNWPAATGQLPDFAQLPVTALLRWRASNPDLNLPTTPELGSYTHGLALLHMKFKRTFLHEPEANFSSVWIRDRFAFTFDQRASLRSIPDAQLRNAEIRRHMMAAYEPEMLARVEKLPRPALAPPPPPKLTVQKGSFEEPESFDEERHPGEERSDGGAPETTRVDRTMLTPEMAKRRPESRRSPGPSERRREE